MQPFPDKDLSNENIDCMRVRQQDPHPPDKKMKSKFPRYIAAVLAVVVVVAPFAPLEAAKNYKKKDPRNRS